MNIKSVCSKVLTVVITLSSLAACTMEDAEEPIGPTAAETARDPEPEPVETDTTSPANAELVSGGASASLFCTLCKAQGCQCGAGRCINCGLKAP